MKDTDYIYVKVKSTGYISVTLQVSFILKPCIQGKESTFQPKKQAREKIMQKAIILNRRKEIRDGYSYVTSNNGMITSR